VFFIKTIKPSEFSTRITAANRCATQNQLQYRVIPVPHPLLFLIPASLTVELSMQNRTDTLEIGSRAPDFSLGAANREGTFTLSGLIEKGTLILEFLRGTW
jgi:hypothetical protein